MRIIYLHQYFKTPQTGGAIRSYHLAKGMVDAGHEVEMITAHNEPRYEIRDVDGIKVHYLPVPYSNEFGFLKRIKAFYDYVKASKKLIAKLPLADLIYATSTPLTVGYITLWAKKKLGVPYIFEVRDLWPEAPVQTGTIRNPIAKKYLYSLEKKIYQAAQKVVALSPGMRNYIEKIVPEKEIHLIPNFADIDFFKKDLSVKNHVKNLVISYTGALGKVNRLESLLEIAQKTQEANLPIQYKIMGEGAELPKLKQLSSSMKLSNVTFIPFGSKEEVKKLLDVSDAIFISFDKIPILETNSPNKFFDGLAAGKLIITNTKGWIKDMAITNKFGFYVDTDLPESFVKLIRPFLEDPYLLQSYQQHARDMAEAFFSREISVHKILRVIDQEHRIMLSGNEVYILTA